MLYIKIVNLEWISFRNGYLLSVFWLGLVGPVLETKWQVIKYVPNSQVTFIPSAVPTQGDSIENPKKKGIKSG